MSYVNEETVPMSLFYEIMAERNKLLREKYQAELELSSEREKFLELHRWVYCLSLIKDTEYCCLKTADFSMDTAEKWKMILRRASSNVIKNEIKKNETSWFNSRTFPEHIGLAYRHYEGKLNKYAVISAERQFEPSELSSMRPDFPLKAGAEMAVKTLISACRNKRNNRSKTHRSRRNSGISRRNHSGRNKRSSDYKDRRSYRSRRRSSTYTSDSSSSGSSSSDSSRSYSTSSSSSSSDSRSSYSTNSSSSSKSSDSYRSLKRHR